MSCMRGDPYIWSDMDGNLHIRTGGQDGPEVSLTEDQFNGLAVMRVAQLREEGRQRLDAVADMAIAKWSGNFGCEALRMLTEEEKQALLDKEKEIDAL